MWGHHLPRHAVRLSQGALADFAQTAAGSGEFAVQLACFFYFNSILFHFWLCGLFTGACGILVPQPGIEPTSAALQRAFLTTGQPGKSPSWLGF